MNAQSKRRPRGLTAVLALLGGASITLSLAPFNLWPLALLGPTLLYLLQRHQSVRQAAWSGWAFGLGFWGAGVSWVYVSIDRYGGAPPWLAGTLTFLFVAALALLFALQGALFARMAANARHRWLMFILTWLGFEWLRSWFLTGFPWLYLGYAWLDTPFKSWAPIGGVWALSLLSLLLSMGLARLLADRHIPTLIPGVVLAATAWLLPAQWTQPKPDAGLDVVMIQPNIPQLAKWQPDQLDGILQRQINMSLSVTDADVIVWPETAIPATFSRASQRLTPFLNLLQQDDIALISGFPYVEADPERPRGVRFHNSLGIFGAGQDIYHKQRLVPFGEYVPFEDQLRGLIAFFDLPMSSFTLPRQDTDNLSLGTRKIAPAICYEIAYPQLVAELGREAEVILTVSNDTWFGRSIAPDQHLQIARMRALENGRWVIRATNNGLTAFIRPDGSLAAQAPVDEQAILRHEVDMMTGQTPWQYLGVWPLAGLLTLMGLFAARRPG